MTVTYTDDTIRNDSAHDEVFVPRYARTGRARRKGSVRAWMILLPVGALALAGGAAAVMMSGETGEGSLVATEEPAPIAQTAPLGSSTAPGVLATGLPSNATITEVAPAPVVREVPPAPPQAVQRRQPVERRAAPVEPAPVVEPAPAESTGLQPYTATLKNQPAATDSRAPAITPAPLS